MYLVIDVRLRNVKNKQAIMDSSNYLVNNFKDYKGRWNEYFGNSNNIHIEIGTGKGDFIIENAIRHPEINFIGIEKFDSVIARCLQKIPEGLNNLAMIRMDAIEINEVFDKEIDVIYLNFSDPWPKNRHESRRLTSKLFLDKYEGLFKNDITIIQKTDNQKLFEFSLMSFSHNNYILEDLTFDYHNANIDNIDDIIMTEYEKRFSGLGQNIYYVKAIKKMSNR